MVAVPMLDGNHIRSWSKEEAAKVPALAEQAARAQRSVYVATDIGLLTVWGLKPGPGGKQP